VIVVSTILMLAGGVFLVVSAVGLARLPEVYTRAHAVAKSETLGLMLVFAGLFFRPELDVSGAIRLVAIMVFSIIANPTAVHALVRAARREGVPSWRADRLSVAPVDGPDGPDGPGDGAGPGDSAGPGTTREERP
jgi:multicomponent Na+:H+ antiporter subunit G